MPSLFLIGTHLIILAHVHSFVLLTANFDDVKKLAQKFVSESIADTIAEFVAKASNIVDKRMSKEIVPKSRDPLDSESVSDEDKDMNSTKESISKENMKYKPKTLNTKIQKTRFESRFMNASEIKPKKKKEKFKKIEENKKFNNGFIEKKVDMNDLSEDSANNNVSVESTAGSQDEKVPDKDLESDQEEEPASDYDFRYKKESKEKNIKIDGPATLTTRREKIEFDQYDPKYPKAVATSGGVTLRLPGSEKSKYRNENLSETNESS